MLPNEILERILRQLSPTMRISSSVEEYLSYRPPILPADDRSRCNSGNDNPFEDLSTLFNCILTCKRFAAIGIPILWEWPRFDRMSRQNILDLAWNSETDLESSQHVTKKKTSASLDQFERFGCSVFTWTFSDTIPAPYMDYCKFIRVLTYDPCRSGRSVEAYPLFCILPKCTNVKFVDFFLLGRLKVCDFAHDPTGENDCACMRLYKGLLNLRPRLQYLSFNSWNGRGFGDIVGYKLKRLLTNYMPIESVHPMASSQISRASPSIVSPSVQNGWVALKKLDLSECYMLTDKMLILLGRYFPNLKSINLSSLPFITDNAISALFDPLFYDNQIVGGSFDDPQCRKTVKSVDMSFCPQLTDNAVVTILRNCPQIRNLNISHCPSLTTSLPLKIFCNIRQDVCNGECYGSKLESLSMIYSSVNDIGVQMFERCGKNLKSLRLMSCKQISIDSIISLISARAISNCKVRNDREMRNLRYLDLSFCDGVIVPYDTSVVFQNRDGRQLWDDGGCILSDSNLSNLQQLLETRSTRPSPFFTNDRFDEDV